MINIFINIFCYMFNTFDKAKNIVINENRKTFNHNQFQFQKVKITFSNIFICSIFVVTNLTAFCVNEFKFKYF